MNDFLIIGHGLAGSVLAHKLRENGHKVTVFDNHKSHSASNVSVGLVNPLIGPKLNPPENIIPCLSENKLFFASLEKAWGESFYKSIYLHRIFKTEQQRDLWLKKLNNSVANIFTGSLINSDAWERQKVLAPFGSGHTKNAYKLDVKKFLKISKEVLKSSDSWESGCYTNIKKSKKQTVIFCEGFRVIENDLFNNLPFAPARGEVIKIKSALKLALNNGSWHLPTDEKTAQIGSNWDHTNFTCGPTEIGKSEIFKNCSFYNFKNTKVINHLSGVRSGTIDRNPIIGEHEIEKNCFIFNGFGSRGTATIPYYANKLIDLISHKKPIPQEANLLRFNKNK